MHFLATTSFWQSVIEIGLPVALAGLGVLLTSRTGYLNVGAEGVMLLGAFFGAAGTVWMGSLWAGLLLAALVGTIFNWFVAWLAIKGRMGDVLAGLTVDIAAIGFTSFLASEFFGSGFSLGSNSLDHVTLFGETPIFYVLLVTLVGLEVILRRTRLGLVIRAAGEGAEAAQTLGVHVTRLRLSAAAASGALIGLAGAALSVGSVGTFVNNMTAGRGFVALAVVFLGAWRPMGVVIAAGVFGFADSIQFYVGQGTGATAQIVAVLPYFLVAVFGAAAWGHAHAPAEESANVAPVYD